MELCYKGLRTQNLCGQEGDLEDFKEYRRSCRNKINGIIIEYAQNVFIYLLTVLEVK